MADKQRQNYIDGSISPAQYAAHLMYQVLGVRADHGGDGVTVRLRDVPRLVDILESVAPLPRPEDSYGSRRTQTEPSGPQEDVQSPGTPTFKPRPWDFRS